jgi:hypothetical protein
MKIQLFIGFVFISLNFVSIDTCVGQTDSTSQQPTKLILTDGSELMGTILQQDSVTVYFKTFGEILITVPKIQIKSIDFLSGKITSGRYTRVDPNYTRLFFAPTARPLKSGNGYFAGYEVLFPFVAYGINDFIILAGGISLFPGAESQIFYLAPKITAYHTENFSAGCGLLYLNSTVSDTKGGGIYYGIGTYGDQETAITFGMGWGFVKGETANKPIFLLGGELQLSNSLKLLSENWIPSGLDIGLLSIGIRFFGENLAADLGLIHPAGSEIPGFPFFPWIGFVYNFGSSK